MELHNKGVHCKTLEEYDIVNNSLPKDFQLNN